MIELTHYRISQAQMASERATNQWFKNYWLKVVAELKATTKEK